mgnify:CR=1 FL=1
MSEIKNPAAELIKAGDFSWMDIRVGSNQCELVNCSKNALMFPVIDLSKPIARNSYPKYYFCEEHAIEKMKESLRWLADDGV